MVTSFYSKYLKDNLASLILFSSQIFKGGAAFLSGILLLKLLSVEDYGIFVFFQSFMMYVALIMEGGVSISASRMLSLENDTRKQKNIFSTFIGYYFILSLLVASLITVGSNWIADLFNIDISNIFYYSTLPAVGFLFITAFREILVGMGRPILLSIIEVIPWVLFVLLLVVFIVLDIETSTLALIIYFGLSFTLAVLVSTFVITNNGFSFKFKYFKDVLHVNKKFGINIYLGRLIGTGGVKADILLLGVFTGDLRSIGYYGLAKALVAPISLIPQVFASVAFRSMAQDNLLPMKEVSVSIVSTAILCGFYALVGGVFIDWIFPDASDTVKPLFYVWLLNSIFISVYQWPNMYLRANGQSTMLRNAAFIFGAFSITIYLLLIPKYGAMGASIGSAMASLLWVVMLHRGYKNYRFNMCLNKKEAGPVT